MKKSLNYSIISDAMYQTTDGLMEVRIQDVTFTKKTSGGETISHKAQIITRVDTKKHKLISLLTNDMNSDPNDNAKTIETTLEFLRIGYNDTDYTDVLC